ncbi:hypothetical protein EMPS_02696 [Entomortierella parvispora]|uniref:rhizopuspepsin n=1 Tax=Entomortierella parvispora TaxID=205924 RepID=A0A9P3H5D4_9FUNG|nr:hypothetical protein EMPS_02696 [Entomortierella parvispora]
MKITALVSVAAAIVAIAEAGNPNGHSIPLTRNPHFKHNTPAQIAKLNARYPGLNINKATTVKSGKVPVTDVHPDLEYYGTVSVGTPAQKVKLDFDTGSSDIWFPSSTCNTSACKKHTRFNASKSKTYKKDGRKWNIGYGDGSSASGILGSDIVNVGGISVRQTIGLATAESSQFASSPEDGLFGLAFSTIESVSGVKTFMDNAIAAKAISQPVVSVFLPSVRRNGGKGGEYLFGAIDKTKYTGNLHNVPVSQQGYWQILIEDASYNGVSLKQTSQGIVDTGTTLVIVSDAAAKAIHGKIKGAKNDPNNGWVVPCSLTSSKENVGFKLNGKTFNVPLADVAYEPLDDGSGDCFSGIQGGQNGLWILGDVFIKNNYCVFSHSAKPYIAIAPLKY